LERTQICWHCNLFVSAVKVNEIKYFLFDFISLNQPWYRYSHGVGLKVGVALKPGKFSKVTPLDEIVFSETKGSAIACTHQWLAMLLERKKAFLFLK